MTPLPPPRGRVQPGLPQPRRKSSIRTAAGTAQEQFLQRLRDLRDEPTRVLPEAVGPEPAPVARLRSRLEAMQGKPPGLMARLDRGIVGGVARSIRIAGRTEVPRLLDAKVAGARRFWLPVGHVDRLAVLGVQNHDEPLALLLAYTTLARKHGLHFFAGPGLWCTGSRPQPPQEWVDGLAQAADIRLQPEPAPTGGERGGGWSCPHPGGAVLLGFRDGPHIAVCGACGKRADGFHKRLAARYLGPKGRQPVEVELRMPDGTVAEPDREMVARYRAGLSDEADLLRAPLEQWRSSAARAFVLGSHAFDTQETFLAHLAPQPWERPALAAMTAAGHRGPETGVAGVLEAHRDRLAEGLDAILGPREGEAFMRPRAGMAVRDLLRAASDTARQRQAASALPQPRGVGPVGAFIDGVARLSLSDGRQAALQPIRRAFETHGVGRSHLHALVQALGGDLSLDARFTHDERHAGQEMLPAARRLLEARGEDYLRALHDYLVESGSGEAVEGF